MAAPGGGWLVGQDIVSGSGCFVGNEIVFDGG